MQDSRKNFRHRSSTGLTLADFHRLEAEHRARNRGGFNADGALVKKTDLVLFARQQVELHNEKLLARACLPTCLPACAPVCLPACPRACLLTCLSTHLPTRLPT